MAFDGARHGGGDQLQAQPLAEAVASHLGLRSPGLVLAAEDSARPVLQVEKPELAAAFPGAPL